MILNMDNNCVVAVSKQIPLSALCRLHKKRWMILLLYCICTIFSTLQLFQYLVISETFIAFYNITNLNPYLAVAKYIILYAVFSFPGMYWLEKIGLRYSIIIAMFGNVVGAWLKLVAADPDRYWVFILSQSIVCVFQVLVLPAPPKLASTWFGPNEVSTACGIATVGFQVGILVAMILDSPLTVNNLTTTDVQNDLWLIAVVVATVSSVQFVLLFFFFQDKPPDSPSPAQIKMMIFEETFILKQTLSKLFKNYTYKLIVVAYTLSQGVLISILFLLGQIITYYCPDSSNEVDLMRLVMIVTGIVGSVLSGMVLDKYRNYKTLAIAALGFSFLLMISFTLMKPMTIATIYARTALLGFFLRAMTTITFEAVAEVTYPEPIAIASSILTCLPLVISALVAFVYSHLFSGVGHVCANLVLSTLILISIGLITCARFNLNRHNSQK